MFKMDGRCSRRGDSFAHLIGKGIKAWTSTKGMKDGIKNKKCFRE